SINSKLRQQPVISFYHQQWAKYVCNHLLSDETSSIYKTIVSFYQSNVLPVYYLWKTLYESPKIKRRDIFLKWLITNTRFEIYTSGEFLLMFLNLDNEEISLLKEFDLPEDKLSSISETQLINLSFIKSVILN
ncbi:MAG: hypothetical protein ACFFD1_13205, partial [Candidatus Thorarchaeota archaeon]